MANLSKTTLYNDVKRLVDRCQAVFGCLDAEYDVDDIMLDYARLRSLQVGHGHAFAPYKRATLSG